MNTLEFVVIAIAIIFLLLSNLHNIYKQNKQIALTKKLRKDVGLLLLDLGFNIDCNLADTFKYAGKIIRRDDKKIRDKERAEELSKLWADIVKNWKYDLVNPNGILNVKPCCKPAYKPTDGIADPNANKPTDDIKAKQNEAINGQKYSKGFTVHADKPGLQLGRVIKFKDLTPETQERFGVIAERFGVIVPETVFISSIFILGVTLSYDDKGATLNVDVPIDEMKPFYHLKARKTKPE